MSTLKLTVPTLKFRRGLARFLQLVAYKGATVTVTRCGQVMAVLSPPPVEPLGDPTLDTLAQADRLSAAEQTSSTNSLENSAKTLKKQAIPRHSPARAPAGKRRKS